MMDSKDKTYAFSFSGSYEDFLAVLRKKGGVSSSNFYYFDDYIVDLRSGCPAFGIERAGHSGGYWYPPKMQEENGMLRFEGSIHYRSSLTGEESEEKKRGKLAEKIIDYVGFILFCILVLPIILLVLLYLLIKRLVKGKPPKVLSTEDRLFDLMVNRLHCTPCPDDKSAL